MVKYYPSLLGHDARMEFIECEELVEQVTDYLEGELDPEAQARMDQHLSLCIGCESHMGEVNVTLRLMASLPSESLPDELETNLVAMYRQWTESVSL
jgi:hypothetical protein